MRGIRGGPGMVDGAFSSSGWLSERRLHDDGGGAGIVSTGASGSPGGGNGVDARRASSVGGAGSVMRSSSAFVSQSARISEWRVGWTPRSSLVRRAGATGFMVRVSTT